MLNLSQLFTFSYYWDSTPGGEFPFGFPLLGFFVLLIFLPGFLRKMAAKDKYLKKSMKKRLGKFVFLGVFGIFLTLFRFAEVSTLSKRLWLYIVFISAVVGLIVTLIQVHRDYKKRLKSVEREVKK